MENEKVDSATKMDKVKLHFRKHKTKYLMGTSVVIVGGVSFYIGRKYQDKLSSIGMNVINDISPTNIAIGKDILIDNRTEITNNVTNTVNMGGHVRKIVKRLSDNKLYSSVQEAAEDAGVSQSTMSNHLNGKLNHVRGEYYEIAGIGTN